MVQNMEGFSPKLCLLITTITKEKMDQLEKLNMISGEEL